MEYLTMTIAEMSPERLAEERDLLVQQPFEVMERSYWRLAKQQDLIATKSRKDGLWYFADLNNVLVSYTNGLNAQEAWEFLREGR